MPNPILMRKLRGVGAAAASAPPSFATNLVLRLESSDYDASANLDAVNSWSDKSGQANHFTATSTSYNPWVDQVNTLNGHASIRFQSSTLIRHLALKGVLNATFTGVTNFTAGELTVIYKKDYDPSIATSQGGPFCCGVTVSEDAWPFVDGNFYMNAFDYARPNLGNPTQDMKSWHAVNVRASKNGTGCDRITYVGSQKLEDRVGGGTWQDFNSGANRQNFIGRAYAGASGGNSMIGNIAAVYLWSAVLDATTRGIFNDHINSLWGITVPNT